MQKIYILKIGGSIATNKSKPNLIINKKILSNLAKEISQWLKQHPNYKLILIHGAGGPSHHLAKKYTLTEGALKKKKRWQGSILSRIANQSLNLSIFKIFSKEKLNILPVHSGSVIIQQNKSINTFNTKPISLALSNNYIPLLYGEMVFDESLGMTICSGDTIAAHLTKKFNVKKVFFATDVNGIFNKDPHINKNTKLIEQINFSDVFNTNISVSSSHNQDATDGLRGKLKAFKNKNIINSLEQIIIFNGTSKKTCFNALNGSRKQMTTIFIDN